MWKGTEVLFGWVLWKRRCWVGRKLGSMRGRQGQTSLPDRGECWAFLGVSCNSHFYYPHGVPELEGT